MAPCGHTLAFKTDRSDTHAATHHFHRRPPRPYAGRACGERTHRTKLVGENDIHVAPHPFHSRPRGPRARRAGRERAQRTKLVGENDIFAAPHPFHSRPPRPRARRTGRERAHGTTVVEPMLQRTLVIALLLVPTLVALVATAPTGPAW